MDELAINSSASCPFSSPGPTTATGSRVVKIAQKAEFLFPPLNGFSPLRSAAFWALILICHFCKHWIKDQIGA